METLVIATNPPFSLFLLWQHLVSPPVLSVMYSRLLLFLLLWLGSDDEFKFAACFVTVGCWKRVAKVVVFLGNECFYEWLRRLSSPRCAVHFSKR